MTPVIESPGLADGRNSLYVEISPFDKSDMFPQNHLDSTEDEKTEIFQSSYDFSGPDGNSNNYQDGGSLPSAVFSYDMSPMQV